MIGRDLQCQRCRRGGVRLSDVDSPSLEAVGVGTHTYGSPVRVPLTRADSMSFMPTPQVDARMGNPFLDPNQVPGLNQDAGLQAFHAGDTSGGQPLLQSPLHSTPHPIPHPVVVPTSQRTLEPPAQATSQQSEGRILPWSEHEVAVRDKSLIEPEGDTYLLYYPFTKYEMLLVCNSMLVILCSSI
ncbi:hypothetical protein Cgig2_026190 [Carnegiea gigantea]|uniref:Uncharacterized protein n=1 Tax=Carnegiea gigantea TaxID=171969 RepID=A0A9Q1K5N8_9CARY|nr:hypothetical protein Cgig2_026190 [Carnegiea gigantea]